MFRKPLLTAQKRVGCQAGAQRFAAAQVMTAAPLGSCDACDGSGDPSRSGAAAIRV
jgi:hypothetical protein